MRNRVRCTAQNHVGFNLPTLAPAWRVRHADRNALDKRQHDRQPANRRPELHRRSKRHMVLTRECTGTTQARNLYGTATDLVECPAGEGATSPTNMLCGSTGKLREYRNSGGCKVKTSHENIPDGRRPSVSPQHRRGCKRAALADTTEEARNENEVILRILFRRATHS